uniref:Uncharacterized protein n=1 Tax=Cannabis sativa TaxID=3483 RepID=A0A803P6X1_CANSA
MGGASQSHTIAETLVTTPKWDPVDGGPPKTNDLIELLGVISIALSQLTFPRDSYLWSLSMSDGIYFTSMAEADKFAEEMIVDPTEEPVQEAKSAEPVVAADSSHWEMDWYKNKLCNILILWSYKENTRLKSIFDLF